MALFPSREVALQIGGVAIYWYGLLYLSSFLLAYALLPRLQHERRLDLTKDEWASILSATILGVIIGGRLGFIFFYRPSILMHDPMEVFRVWNGGMSSHGGFIGVTIALLFALRSYKGSILRIADVIVIPIALGLAMGRLGNFINQELYGTVSTLPWATSYPEVEGLRHPLPLYGIIKNLMIASLCYMHLHRRLHAKPGQTLALFLILYGLARFALEFVRYQEYSSIGVLSRGQFLTVPIIVSGLVLWMYATFHSSR